MRRLIWGFAGRTYNIVGNLMWRLNYIYIYIKTSITIFTKTSKCGTEIFRMFEDSSFRWYGGMWNNIQNMQRFQTINMSFTNNDERVISKVFAKNDRHVVQKFFFQIHMLFHYGVRMTVHGWFFQRIKNLVNPFDWRCSESHLKVMWIML